MITNAADLHIDINNRPDDKIKALDQVATISNEGELLLIEGDIYHSRRPTPTEQNIFRDFLLKLKVPTIIGIGNHDENLGASTLDEFLKFPHENIKLVRLPYIVEHKGIKVYMDHCTVEGAKLGPADLMVDIKEAIPIKKLLENNCDFYAFGHIHKAQMLKKSPPMFYTGSIERVDFAERNEDKFVFVIESKEKYGYKKLNIRDMIQWDIDLTQPNLKSNELIRKPDTAIVKVMVKGTKELIAKFNEAPVREELKNSFSYSIQYEVVKTDKTRNEAISELKTVGESLVEYGKQMKLTEGTVQKGLEIINKVDTE